MKDGTEKDGILEDQGKIPLWMTTPFCEWMRGGCIYLNEAERLSNELFEKKFNDLWTYEQNYVVNKMAHVGF